jgi:L-threonylcarbamoyladenylate synthase
MRLVEANPDNILLAAAAIRRGELVGMPTETVYGVACDALNPVGVQRVFAAKGRPADNPLIVHLATLDELPQVARDWPALAIELAHRFWPGPLTLVLYKADRVPEATTGGLETVAVRMPNHPVAAALIRASKTPIAAPSANRFMALSATRAEDLDPALAGHLTMVLDGGPCPVGLESTVLDLTGDRPRILRPGGVPRGAIQAAMGEPLAEAPPNAGDRRSPGLYPRHYAPRTAVRLTDRLGDAPGIGFGPPRNGRQIRLPRDAQAYGAMLYAALHRLDGLGVEQANIERPPAGPDWEAIHDRLNRMSGGA